MPARFILFAGDVTRDKGVGVLLEAHALLDDPPPLVLVGRVVEPELLTGTAPERVHAVGAQPHDVVLDAFRRCTVAVAPSLMHEAFGLVALEAMSAGKPVIASRIGGLPDIIRDDQDGLLVEPGDVEALRAALARVLTPPDVAARLGAAAKRRAATFSADLIVPRVEQAYRDVMEGREEQQADEQPAATRASDVARRAWAGLRRREHRVVLALTALGIAGAALPAGAWTALRTMFVLPLALFLPGYALTPAIFRTRGPAFVEPVALALSLSLVTTALVSLLLYVASLGLTLGSWVTALAVVTVAATVVAAAHASPEEPETAAVSRRLPPLRPVQVGIGLVAAALVATAVALAVTPLSSPAAPGYTALWLTRAGASGLTLGVRSEEHHTTRYVLRLRLGRRTTTRRFALAPGQTWQEQLPGARRAAASLYRAGHGTVYRSVSFGAPTPPGR